VVLRCAEPDVRARALFLLAQLETMAGKPNAGPLWEALAHKYPKSSLADDALFNQALSERRAGNPDQERALLRELADGYLDGDLRGEAIFRLFWSYWLAGEPRKGLTYLDQLAAHPDSEGVEEERARYWRAPAPPPPAGGGSGPAGPRRGRGGTGGAHADRRALRARRRFPQCARAGAHRPARALAAAGLAAGDARGSAGVPAGVPRGDRARGAGRLGAARSAAGADEGRERARSARPLRHRRPGPDAGDAGHRARARAP